MVLYCMTSCKINQKLNGENIGKWKYVTKYEHETIIEKGRYNKSGLQKGTWRYKKNGRLFKKEVFRDTIASVLYYHSNGKIHIKGQIAYTEKNKLIHYYYYGPWFIYNKKEKLTDVKHYKEGILTHHTVLKND